MNDLQQAIKENMSPQGVGMVCAHIVGIGGNSAAAKEARWLAEQLVEIVGGHDAMSDIYEEIGV